MSCIGNCISDCFKGYHTSEVDHSGDSWVKDANRSLQLKLTYPPIEITPLKLDQILRTDPPEVGEAITDKFLADNVFVYKGATANGARCYFRIYHPDHEQVTSVTRSYKDTAAALVQYARETTKRICMAEIVARVK
jgi:hypothetical protein